MVPDLEDQHPLAIVADLVDDPMVTGADAPFAIATRELLRAGRAGLLGQELYGGLDAATCRRIEPSQLSGGCRRVIMSRSDYPLAF